MELTSREKEEVWASFLSSYSGDNPYSIKDNELNDKAQERYRSWKEYGMFLDELERTRLVKEEEAKKRKLVLVKNIRHWSTPTYTRVIIDLERPTKYKKHLLRKDPDLRKPRRLFVDLQNTWISKDIESSIAIKDGLLRGARAAQYNKNTVRVVLDIDNMEGYKIFHLYDPFRIVVDAQGKERKQIDEDG